MALYARDLNAIGEDRGVRKYRVMNATATKTNRVSSEDRRAKSGGMNDMALLDKDLKRHHWGISADADMTSLPTTAPATHICTRFDEFPNSGGMEEMALLGSSLWRHWACESPGNEDDAANLASCRQPSAAHGNSQLLKRVDIGQLRSNECDGVFTQISACGQQHEQRSAAVQRRPSADTAALSQDSQVLERLYGGWDASAEVVSH